MTISIDSEVLPEYVRVTCAGTYSLDAALRLFEQALALAAEAGRTAVLIDSRALTGTLPTLADRYAHGARVAELQAAQNPRIRMAVLGREPMIHPERYGEIVATSRGAAVRTFTDEALALDWVLGRR